MNRAIVLEYGITRLAPQLVSQKHLLSCEPPDQGNDHRPVIAVIQAR